MIVTIVFSIKSNIIKKEKNIFDLRSKTYLLDYSIYLQKIFVFYLSRFFDDIVSYITGQLIVVTKDSMHTIKLCLK